MIQTVNINVAALPALRGPGSFMVLSQNENGRQLRFRILGSDLPTGCTATFSGTKPDGNVYSTTGTVIGNFVIVQEDIQMTAVAGIWDAKLEIAKGTENIVTSIIRVTVVRDPVAGDAIPSDSQLDGIVTEVKYYAEHARSEAYGSPLTASTKSAMTDKTRVYVYTGSESGMTAGNWYYWNGSAWTSGGVYNSVAVQSDTELNDFSTNPVQNKVIKAALDQIEGAIPEIDATLSVSGKAADAKKTGDEISSLKEDLTQITEASKNLMVVTDKQNTVKNVTTNYSDGILNVNGTANADGGRTKAVAGGWELPAGEYTFSADNLGNLQIFLEKSTGDSIVATLQGSTLQATFTLEATTRVYVGINVSNGVTYNATIHLQIEVGDSATYWVKPSLLVGVDEEARHAIADIGAGYTQIQPVWTSGKVFIYNQGWIDNAYYSYTDIDLVQGQGLNIQMYAVAVTYPVTVWSGDGNTVIRPIASRPANDGMVEYNYICHAQNEKIRINVQNAYKTSVVLEKFTINNIVNNSNILAEQNNLDFTNVLYSNIIAIGDSLTQGSYTGYDLHPTQSYPAFLSKMMGCNVENAGRAGWTTLEWFVGDSATQKGFPYYDYSDYDTAIIFLGTNGGLEDVVDDGATSTTNTGAYCSIIEGMRTQNPNINIFLCNLWTSGGTGGVILANQVIEEIAEKYNLPMIDLKSEFITLYGAYRAVQNNIHLGRIGYAKMASIIKNALNKQVYVNPTPYNYIPE